MSQPMEEEEEDGDDSNLSASRDGATVAAGVRAHAEAVTPFSHVGDENAQSQLLSRRSALSLLGVVPQGSRCYGQTPLMNEPTPWVDVGLSFGPAWAGLSAQS